MNSDFKELLSIFNATGVKYLIVGGYAVSEYSEPRYTKDLDVWIEASAENGSLVFEALNRFGAPLQGLRPEDFATPGCFYQMGVPPVRVDILMSISGLEFENAWPNRNSIDFFGIPANMISREDLIATKRSSGRTRDLADVEVLELAASEPSDN